LRSFVPSIVNVTLNVAWPLAGTLTVAGADTLTAPFETSLAKRNVDETPKVRALPV
jgi:hypothetical protein